MFKKMSKKIAFVTALACLCALSVFLVNCGSTSSQPTGMLYVLTEAANPNGSVLGNDVSSYAIDLNTGGITLINAFASTCPTAASTSEPEPCGLPLNIVLDAKGETAFVLDQGIPSVNVAPMIYGYPVKSDGSLGQPTPAFQATGALPGLPITMTRDAAGQFLFVINRGVSPTAANCGTTPPSVDCASISVFSMQTGSTTLTEVSGSPFPVNRLPSALTTIPYTAPASTTLPCSGTTDLLYVTFNSDPVYQNDNTLSSYCVGSSGAPIDLTPNTPYVINSSDPVSVLGVNTNPAGESTGGIFVYIGTQPSGSGSLSIFQLCTVAGEGPGEGGCLATQVNNATLLPVAGTPPSTGQDPTAMVVDPTNNFLYVACQLSNQVYGYRINTTTGVLTALTPVYEPTGSLPAAMAMQPSVKQGGEYLYVSNTNSSNIIGFTVNTATGGLSSPSTVISYPGPTGMAAQ